MALRMSANRRRSLATAGVSLLSLAFFYRTLFSATVLDGYDIVQAFFHYRQFVRTALLSGTVPLWNPYIFCGYPSLAALQSSIFHPFTYLLLAAPTWLNINLSVYCYAVVGCYGMARFITISGGSSSAGIFAGLAYTYNLFIVRHLKAGHLTHLCSMLSLPLLAAFWEAYNQKQSKPILVGAAFFAASIILLGHPQFFYLVIVGLVLYQLLQTIGAPRNQRLLTLYRALTFDVVSLGIACVLSACQLLPAFEFMGSINRSGGSSYEFLTDSSVPVINLLTYIAPNLFGDGMTVPYWGEWYLWEVTSYLGIATMILVFSGLWLHGFRDRTWRIWLFAAVIVMVVALGRYAPVYAWLLRALPGLSLFRNPGRFLFVANFFLCAAAGWTIDKLGARSMRRRVFGLGAVSVVGAVVVLGIFLGQRQSQPACWSSFVQQTVGAGVHPFPLSGEEVTRINSSAHKLLLSDLQNLAIFLGLTALSFALLLLRPAWGKILLCLTLTADLLIQGSKYLTGIPPATIMWPDRVQQFLLAKSATARVLPFLSQADLNVPMSLGVRSPGGYDSTCPARFNDVILAINGETPGTILTSVQPYRFGPLWPMLAVRYLILPESIGIGALKFTLALDAGTLKVYENQRPLSRHYLAGRVHPATTRQQALKALSNPAFDPCTAAVVESAFVPHDLGSSESNDALQPELETLHRIKLTASCTGSRLLVTADSWDRGWRAFIDQVRAPLLPVNVSFRGLWLPPGVHEVEFRYEPFSYKLGLFLTLLTVTFVAAYFIACFTSSL